MTTLNGNPVGPDVIRKALAVYQTFLELDKPKPWQRRSEYWEGFDDGRNDTLDTLRNSTLGGTLATLTGPSPVAVTATKPAGTHTDTPETAEGK